MKSSIILCLGLAFIISSVILMFFDAPVISNYWFFYTYIWSYPEFISYPLSLPSIILMIVGILLVIIGVGMKLNLYGKKVPYND
jgi:uncharacterized protein YjeT (DUF2065 family)